MARGFQAPWRRASSSAATSSSIVPASASMAMMSPSLTSAIGPPTAASGPTWPTQKPRVRAGEAAVGDQRHLVAHALAVERRGRRQHLAHAGAAARALVADHQHVAVLVVAPADRREARLLAVEAAGRAAELAAPSRPATLTMAPSGASEPFKPDDAAGRRERAGGRPDHVLVVGNTTSARFSAIVRPVTVMQSPWMKPPSSSAFSSTGTPPTSYMSLAT